MILLLKIKRCTGDCGNFGTLVLFRDSMEADLSSGNKSTKHVTIETADTLDTELGDGDGGEYEIDIGNCSIATNH
jgi:hypothetical protein